MIVKSVKAMMQAVVLSAISVAWSMACAQSSQYLYQDTIHIPVEAMPGHGMVDCQMEVACRVGGQILRDGGNAVDAAVATAFALAVALPRAGNIGGGGFMLVYMKKEDRVVAFDYRSMAPSATKLADYVGGDGKLNGKEEAGYMASGVPGTVAGLWLAHKKFGKLPWNKLVEPAAKLAGDGIHVTVGQALSLNWAKAHHRFVESSEAPKVFVRADGRDWKAGDLLVQSDLAWSLGQIRDHGADAFYKGEVAARLARGMNAHGGIIGLSDLAAYRAEEREPVAGTYRGYRVVTMPPVSGGGTSVIEMLNILENFDLAKYGARSAEVLHYEAEASKLAWRDRVRYAGDPAFAKIPTAGLASKSFAATRAKLISPTRTIAVKDLEPGDPWKFESKETTQISVIDAEGNAVSTTYTLGSDFGSGVMIEGTGFMLGNLISNFSIGQQAESVAKGVAAAINNVLGPGRRPVSSMSPTMVFGKKGLWMVTGTPGGNTIPGTVMQMIVNTVDFGMNIAEATSTARIDQQLRSGILAVEPEVSPDTLARLKEWGHQIEVSRAIGATQTLAVGEDGNIQGAPDPRRPGGVAVEQ